jgi:hypothetical protein
MNAKIYDFAQERAHRLVDNQELLAPYDHLPCPVCDRLTAPFFIDVGGTVSYQCKGHGHRPRGWRINRQGEFMPGLKGSRVT